MPLGVLEMRGFALCLGILVLPFLIPAHDALAVADPFDAPKLEAAIAVLRSEELKGVSDEDLQKIERLQNFLTDSVRGTKGASLRESALAHLESVHADERVRAQILLGRAEEVPALVRARLAVHADPVIRTWAQWWGPEWPPPRSEGLRSDPQLFSTGSREGADPIAALQAEVESRLGRSLQGLPDRFRPEERVWLDLDGDGIDELLACARIPDGDRGERITIMARRDRTDASWSLAYFRAHRPDERYTSSTILDFDGDGLPEVMQRIALVGGWVWDTYRYLTLEEDTEFVGRSLYLTRVPGSERPCLVSRDCFNPTGGGKASYLTTALGSLVTVSTFTPGGVERFEVILPGNGW